MTSLLLMLNMACTLFRLTPEEALAGVTRHAARALGLRGSRHARRGQRADFALWDIGRRPSSRYRIGGNPCSGIVRAGRSRTGSTHEALRRSSPATRRS